MDGAAAQATDRVSEKPPRTIVVTGIQAAGKSTVARMLAQRFERGVHIEADLLYQMIVTGRVLPEEPGVMPPEAERQLRLRLRNACVLARSFHESGFSVVIDEIIIGERYDHIKENLADLPFELVVLAPRAEVVANERDAGRGKRVLGEKWATYLDRELRATLVGIGLWIDNSDQTAEETADEIIRRLEIEPIA
jgi:chloramphenicol 3-O-phosphotransferase